ncbi:MAG TPA: DUF3492 domain-containing protein, partial [Pilimelia sp.]|nr:DUF3492 domain-containing protein [Pilimelia sp.]
PPGPAMRIALIHHAGYPYRRDGVSAWCHELLTGLGQHTYHVLSLRTPDRRPTPAYRPPANVASLTEVAADGPAAPPGGARLRRRRAATAAAVRLARGLLADGPHGDAMFATGLRRLADLAGGGAHPLAGVPLPEVLLDAWQASRTARGAAAVPLPRLSLREAGVAAALVERAVRPLACRIPEVDLCHPVAAGAPLLVALAARWRDGVPFLLTEQTVEVRQRCLEAQRWAPPVRAVLVRFHRAVARLGYAEAGLVSAVSRFDQRWQLRYGPHPAKLVVVPNGHDPARSPALPPPDGCALAWVGPVEPHEDLHTLLRAFAAVRRDLPAATLQLGGPVPAGEQAYADSCRALAAALDLGAAVRFLGPVADPREGFRAAQVVVCPRVADGAADRLVQAMLCARPTVSADAGGAAETVGDAGVLVPPGDPAALAAACLALLRDPPRRAALGAAARARAVRHFGLRQMLAAYDQLYADVRLDHAPSPVAPGAGSAAGAP